MALNEERLEAKLNQLLRLHEFALGWKRVEENPTATSSARLAKANVQGYEEERDELREEIVRGLSDVLGKSYVDIQPSLAECLERFAEVYGPHPDFGNTIWAYTMAACKEIEELREKTKPKKRERCSAFIRHGPGHQSRTRCRLRGGHDGLHETRYGSHDQFATWKGDEVSSGFFNEPPQEE